MFLLGLLFDPLVSGDCNTVTRFDSVFALIFLSRLSLSSVSDHSLISAKSSLDSSRAFFSFITF
jgi:hypothetical protein